MEERCNISYYGYLAGTERIRHSENLRCMIRREEGYLVVDYFMQSDQIGLDPAAASLLPYRNSELRQHGM